MIEEYKRFFIYYISSTFSNYYIKKEDKSIKGNFILISINNALEKLYQYQKLLS